MTKFFRLSGPSFAALLTLSVSTVFLTATLASATPGAASVADPSAAPEHVDVMIVLATDVSGSVDDGEYRMQRDGIVQALRDPEVAQILEQCNTQGAGITYLEWSGESFRSMAQQVISWRVLRNRADLSRFADELENIQNRSSMGSTDVVSALRASAELLAKAPLTASRRFISLSSDGEHNVDENGVSELGYPDVGKMIQRLEAERDRILAQGILIDALVIQNDLPQMGRGANLEEYYRNHVIGGRGARVVPVASFEDYAFGLKQKLLSELDNCLM